MAVRLCGSVVIFLSGKNKIYRRDVAEEEKEVGIPSKLCSVNSEGERRETRSKTLVVNRRKEIGKPVICSHVKLHKPSTDRSWRVNNICVVLRISKRNDRSLMEKSTFILLVLDLEIYCLL